MIQRKHIKMACICMALCCICGMATGCKQKPDENGSLKAEDGRSYGGTIKAKMGEKVQTAFFDMTITSATKSNTFQFEDGLYQADEGKTYLIVTLTIQNTYEKDLPMSITDFVLDYDGNKSEDAITGYGKADLNQDDYMENVFTLKKGESISKSILFTVDDKAAYTIEYSEYYEDKFEGDKYEVAIQPQDASQSATDATTEAATDATTEAATEATAEPSTENTTEAAAEPSTESTAETVTDPATENATE